MEDILPFPEFSQDDLPMTLSLENLPLSSIPLFREKRKQKQHIDYNESLYDLLCIDENVAPHDIRETSKRSKILGVNDEVQELHPVVYEYDEACVECTDDDLGINRGFKFQTRMALGPFYDFLHALSDDQKKSVQETGFGSLLSLELKRIPGQLCAYLAENFDYKSHSLVLEKGDVDISYEDVFCTLNLPCGSEPVLEAKGDLDSPEYIAELARWRSRWNIRKGSPIIASMAQTILGWKEFNDDFKRDFMVYMVSAFLKGHQNSRCNYKILLSLIDTNRIRDLNWCQFAFKSLIESTEAWQQNPDGYFTGPITFLTLCYLDRVEFKYRVIERKFPTLCGWTTEAVRGRVNDELRAGGFGKGRVVDRLYKMQDGNLGVQGLVEDITIPAQPVGPSSAKKDNSERVASIFKKIADDLVELAEVMADVGKSGSCVLRRMFLGLSKVFNDGSDSQVKTGVEASDNKVTENKERLSSSSIEDDDFWSDPEVLEAISKVEKAFEKAKSLQAFDIEAPSFSLGLGLTPPDQHRAEATTSTNVSNTSFDRVPVKIRTPAQVLPCLDSVFAEDLGRNLREDQHRDEATTSTNIGNTSFHRVSVKIRTPSQALPCVDSVFAEDSKREKEGDLKIKAQPKLKVKMGNTSFERVYEKIRTPAQELQCIDSVFAEDCERDSDGDLEIKARPQRKLKNLPLSLRSPFWVRNSHLLDNVSAKSKIVSEYVFMEADEQHPMSEMLFEYKDLWANREIMYSLSDGQKVSPYVIDIWVTILNWANFRRGLGKPHRIFHSTSPYLHFDQKADDQKHTLSINELLRCFAERVDNDLHNALNPSVEDADLVFFPIYEHKHFFIACINFKNKVVEVIDNKVLPRGATLQRKYGSCLDTLVSSYAYYLQQKKIQRGFKLLDYPCKLLKMPWRSSAQLSIDSGVHCMRHLETYRGEGDVWDCGLEKDNDTQMKCLRAKYCANILLAEINSLRGHIRRLARSNIK